MAAMQQSVFGQIIEDENSNKEEGDCTTCKVCKISCIELTEK